MESWRKTWRNGFLPQISTRGLKALLKAVEADDPRLIQGATTMPPPLQCVMEWPVEAACGVGFCGWEGGDSELKEVAEVEEYFAQRCFEADRALSEPAGCRWFLNWFDETPRQEMLRLLGKELRQNISDREAVNVVVA